MDPAFKAHHVPRVLASQYLVPPQGESLCSPRGQLCHLALDSRMRACVPQNCCARLTFSWVPQISDLLSDCSVHSWWCLPHSVGGFSSSHPSAPSKPSDQPTGCHLPINRAGRIFRTPRGPGTFPCASLPRKVGPRLGHVALGYEEVGHTLVALRNPGSWRPAAPGRGCWW